MRKKISKTLLVMLVFIATTMLVNFITLQIDVSNSKQYNVLIEGVGQTINFFGPTQNKWVGSGVVISKDGWVLTAGHCLKNAERIQVTLFDGQTFNLKPDNYYIDPNNDIGLIKLPIVTPKYAILSDSNDLSKGDNIYAVGEADGIWDNSVAYGTVHQIHFKRLVLGENTEFIFIKVSICGGYSGGGAYHYQNLIGIVVTGGENIAFVVPSNICNKFYNKVKDGN